MKKKLLASLLVSSAMVGASLALLSIQAVTTRNTPVQVEFGGGTLPDGGGIPDAVRPDLDATNSNFDLLFIPREFDFGRLSISDDLTKPIPNKADKESSGIIYTESVGVGDIRGTEEGWHVTAQSTGMKLGNENLEGSIITSGINLYPLIHNKETKTYDAQSSSLVDLVSKPKIANTRSFSIPLGGDAALFTNATAGKGQGLWYFSMFEMVLNITTTAYNIKAGNYTGNITQNLVTGPFI